MRALVIGGNGFIGSHLIDKLLSSSVSVRVLDIYPEKYRSPLKEVDYRFGELSDTFLTSEVLEGVDIVFHLASKSVPGTSINNPAADIQENLIPLITLLNQMVKCNIKRIVFLSSGGAVYGNPQILPIPENHQLQPISSYGIVKVAMENYLFSFSKLYGILPIIVRPSNAYGPRQGHTGIQGVIGTLLSKVLTNEPITVWGDGSIVRDYIYVEDIVEFCYLASTKLETGVYNVATGVGNSVKEIIELIASISGIAPEIIYKEHRNYDPDRIVLDISKARQDLHWSPRIDLSEGIQRQLQWLRNHV